MALHAVRHVTSVYGGGAAPTASAAIVGWYVWLGEHDALRVGRLIFLWG